MGLNGEGYEYVRVVVAQSRPPECGDKFAARHGQKGTIGMTYRSYDLPFTQTGITPHIIVNPLAIPSRMTIGMLIEMLQGRKVISSAIKNIPVKKVFCFDNKEWKNPKEKFEEGTSSVTYSKFKRDGDATPFNKDFSLWKIVEELKRIGVNGFSEEKMINGQTGEMMKSLIYFGPVYYQRLKHMVIDKVHARSRGGHTRMTRQPFEGRRRMGGLRIGTMEKDNLQAHGACWMTKDRLMEQSDETKVWFCQICGLMAIVTPPDPKRRIPSRKECRLCETNKVMLVRMPYATKLFIQELAGMNIIIRVLVTSYGEPGDKVLFTDGKKIYKKPGMIVKKTRT